MPRIQIEEALREFVIEVVSEQFQNVTQLDFRGRGRGEQGQPGRKNQNKGQVTDPRHDRRLKQNRDLVA